METENSKRHYFRCQYQLGNIIDESEKVEGEGYLGIEQMILVLLKLSHESEKQSWKGSRGKSCYSSIEIYIQITSQC